MGNVLLIKNGYIINRVKCHLTVALCFLFVGCSQNGHTPGADKLDLRFKPTPGSIYAIRMFAENKVLRGQQTEFTRFRATELSFYVNSTDDKGVTSVKTTVRSIKEKFVNPTGIFEYDYSSLLRSKDNPLSKIYNAMIGESFLIKVTRAGEIAEIDADDMFGLMAEKIVMKEKQIPDANEESRNARIEEWKQDIKDYKPISEDYLKELTDNITLPYPDQAVRAGDIWTHKFKIDTSQRLPIAIETDMTFTLTRQRQGLSSIEVKSEKTLADASIPDSGDSSFYTGSVTIEGNLEINEASGWLIAKKAITRLKGEIKENGVSMPVSVERTITVKSME